MKTGKRRIIDGVKIPLSDVDNGIHIRRSAIMYIGTLKVRVHEDMSDRGNLYIACNSTNPYEMWGVKINCIIARLVLRKKPYNIPKEGGIK